MPIFKVKTAQFQGLRIFTDSEMSIFLARSGFIRDVAQPGSALRSGRRGRWFESSHPDDPKPATVAGFVIYRFG